MSTAQSPEHGAPREYVCDECGGTFETGWSDEEAREEAEALFPGASPEDMAVVCDECFKEIAERHWLIVHRKTGAA